MVIVGHRHVMHLTAGSIPFLNQAIVSVFSYDNVQCPHWTLLLSFETEIQFQWGQTSL